MHMPSPVLVLFGDKNVTEFDPVLLVVVANPHTEVVDVAVNIVSVLLVSGEGQRDEPLPRVTQRKFPNTGTRSADVAVSLTNGSIHNMW